MLKHEREIYVKELLWRVAFGWKYLLIFGLIFAVCVAFFSYLKDMYNYEKKTDEQDLQTIISEDAAFTEEEKDEIQNADLLQNMIDTQQTYINNSIKMNMDANNENVLIMTWYVDSEYQFNYMEDVTINYSTAVSSAYEKYINAGMLAQKIAEVLTFDVDDRYMAELIEFEASNYNSIFSVEIIYPTEDVLHTMIEIIKKEMEQEAIIISEEVEEHSLKLLSTNIMTRTDANLLDYQYSVYDKLFSYKKKLNDMKDSMTPAQLERITLNTKIEKQLDSNSEIKMKPESELERPDIQIKNLLFGFCLGIFIGIIYITLKMLLSAKLQNIEQLGNIYQIRLLGTIQQSPKIVGIDKLLWNIKNRNKKQLLMEENLNIIVSNIMLACKKEKSTKIYLTGSAFEKVDEKLLKKIIVTLQKNNIEVLSGNNVCYVAESLKEMADTGYVIIIEQTELSMYNEISQEIKTIAEQGTTLIGAIGINTIV